MDKMAIQPRSGNSSNPARGKAFQEATAAILSRHFKSDFKLEVPIEIGKPPTDHRFDLYSESERIAVECKRHVWTGGGNAPAAKLGFINEALLYLSFLPSTTRKYVAILRDIHPQKGSLAEHYYRRNRHLLRDVGILEINLDRKSVREISQR